MDQSIPMSQMQELGIRTLNSKGKPLQVSKQESDTLRPALYKGHSGALLEGTGGRREGREQGGS